MKFLSIRGNPYTLRGPSGTLYQFNMEQPIDVTNEADIEWALFKCIDTRPYPKSLVTYDEVLKVRNAASVRTDIYEVVTRSQPATYASMPSPVEVLAENLETAPIKVETKEPKVMLNTRESYFKEFSPDDLSLSVKKILVKIEEFLLCNKLPTLAERIAYVEDILKLDDRITLRAGFEELVFTAKG